MATKKQIDKFPRLPGGEKRALRLSTSLTMRERTPTNPHTAFKGPRMVFDHANQQRLWPDNRPSALIEATHNGPDESGYRTMNRSGHPYALNVELGGSPDYPGAPFAKAPKRSLTEKPSNGRGKGPRNPNGQAVR